MRQGTIFIYLLQYFRYIFSIESDMVGTLNYMSPEQLSETEDGTRTVKVGKWTDTWSLGCILYQMAYNSLPFQQFKERV